MYWTAAGCLTATGVVGLGGQLYACARKEMTCDRPWLGEIPGGITVGQKTFDSAHADFLTLP